MRVEQEQKVTEDARMFAEQDAAAQRYAAQVLQVSRFSSSLVSKYHQSILSACKWNPSFGSSLA